MVIGAQAPEVEEHANAHDGSMIDYLRSAAVRSVPPAAPREKVVQYDPIAKTHELSRPVQATSRKAEPDVKRRRAGLAVGASLASVAAALMVAAVMVGTTPLNVAVPCGAHALQMVAGATKQAVELPCGGESVVRYDAKGHWMLRSK